MHEGRAAMNNEYKDWHKDLTLDAVRALKDIRELSSRASKDSRKQIHELADKVLREYGLLEDE